MVSTSVGGIPEVLPHDMALLAEPNVRDLVDKVKLAVNHVEALDPDSLHERTSSMYNWQTVAQRTEVVYEKVKLLLNVFLSLYTTSILRSAYIPGHGCLSFLIVGAVLLLSCCWVLGAVHCYVI